MALATPHHQAAASHAAVTEWSVELELFLHPRCFPARRDQLFAALIRQHCPSALLWHLSSLPDRRYASLDEVVAAAHGIPGLALGWD